MSVPHGTARIPPGQIAIVGSGIAGLGAARRLTGLGHQVTLFEADARLGGHTHTVEVTLDGISAPVDTGFLVFNEHTYPKLIALFAELGVDSSESEMSFSLRNDAERIEWAGTSLRALFAQPRNALRPAFWRMLAQIARFNRSASASARDDSGRTGETLGEHLRANGYGREFRDWYLIPMAAAIWSSPQADIEDFPFASFARFCANHGLLQIANRPRWRTVTGGGREYVRRIAAELRDIRLATPVTAIRRCDDRVEIEFTQQGAPYHQTFDHVVLACHSDQSLALLADPDAAERAALGEIRYQPNRVLLHTDVALMPRSRRAWSAWNYLAAPDPEGSRPVAVTYWINKLQPLPFRRPVLVTLNPPFDPAPGTVLNEFEYWHPLHDSRAVAAQSRIAALQGRRNTWYAGAWLGYGFHEDGLKSGYAAADAIAAMTSAPGRTRVAPSAIAA
ncbi:MAG: FAD-dependent oxidoreductase [Betaproteobacteria bacterium]